MTELIVFGAPVRTSVGLFLFVRYRSIFAVIAYSLLLINFYPLDIASYSFNFIIFLVCTYSFFVISRVQLLETSLEVTLIKFIMVILILIGFFQSLNVHFFTAFFTDYPQRFAWRASGLSGEPSFFAWSLGFFVVHAYANRSIKVLSLIIILLIGLIISKSFTFLLILIIFASCYIFAIFFRKVWMAVPVILFIYHLVERILFWNKFSVSERIFHLTGSWREISHFSGVYSPYFIGPFSGGRTWSEQLYEAQNWVTLSSSSYTWIVWPWSFSSMLAIELGIFSIFFFLFWVLYPLRAKVIRFEKRVVCTFLIVSGFIFVPKWMVFYFLLPKIRHG